MMSELDLGGVPISFLEAYPFPAFVLVVPVVPTRPRLTSRDTDVTVRRYEDVSPLSIAGPSTPRKSAPLVWANERWLAISGGREVEELDDDDFERWAEGNEDETFTLSLRSPLISLSLAKTLVPLSPPSPTHAFCVVTSQNDGTPSVPRQTPPDFSNRSSISSEAGASFFPDHRDSQTSNILTSISELVPEAANSPALSQGPRKVDRRLRNKRSMRESEIQGPMTSERMSVAAKECWTLLERMDWSKTGIGPRSEWADVIDPILSVAFMSNTQDCLWLGKDYQIIYNMNYAQLVDHPWSFGRPGRECWQPLWAYIEPMMEECFRGNAIYKDNDFLAYEPFGPDGVFKEKYHTWRYIPIRKRDGTVIGVWNQSLDTTLQVLAERRLATVRELSDHMLIARSRKEYYQSIAEVLESNPKDAPFAMVYSVEQTKADALVSHLELVLQTSVGVPNHPAAPPKLNLAIPVKGRAQFGMADHLSSPTLSAISALSSGSSWLYQSADGSWPIAKALSTRQCVIVEDISELIKGFPIRQWEHLPTSAIIVPISSDASIEVPEAVLILGLNWRRPFDSEYDSWVHVIRSQLTSSLTSVKAIEEENRRKEEALRMENAKAAWFRGAAHDLRSPLTLISGPLDDLMDTSLTLAQKNTVQTAKRNVDRLLRLVNTLMDFSRLEAGRVEGRFVPTDLGAFVMELAQVFRPAMERAKIVFNVDIEPNEHLVYIDPTLFETIISNLIGNALKYTESGSITVRLTYGDYADVSVIDTGVGIPQDEIPNVAEWYHRATTAIHSGTQGTGLGLALARELLLLHGGELVVTSRTATETIDGSHGSTFSARVPMTPREVSLGSDFAPLGQYGQAVANEAMRWVPDSDSDSGDATSETHTSGSSSIRLADGMIFTKSDIILVVDDNRDMREYITQVFSPFCKVMEASEGHEGLTMAFEHKPSLIISDYMMPRMNGLEFLKALRADSRTRITPFIMMSAVTGDDARVQALLGGSDDYIAKPFRPKELLARGHLHMQWGKGRAKLERLYIEREIEIKLLSDYCPSGIMRADADGAIQYSNRAWREAAGMLESDDPNKWPQLVDDETQKRLFAEWIPFISGETKTHLRITWKWKTTGRTVQGVFINLSVMSPGMKGILGCLTDITHEEERLVEAEKRRVEAEESKHQQELLIDLTSHEIRTPVSAILQCSSLVKENLAALHSQLKWAGTNGFKPTPELLSDLEEDLEALESIYQCGLVQERIAGDVLSLARIQLDMLSLYDVEMDLRKEARKVISVFASEAKMKKIELVTEFGDTLDQARVFGVKTDPVRLGQVVTNLISNAIRFTASSNVRRITVRYDVSFLPPPDDTCALPSSIGLPSMVPAPEDTPIWLFVSVRDTGPGLGPKELALLFKRFSQGNKMIHTRYGGSGLGLFICRKITELLEGRIEVQSQLGQGSVFRFFIKSRTTAPTSALASLVQSTTSKRSLTPDSSTGSDIVMSTTPPPDIENLHILIVEDNIINQTVLKRQIVKAGLTCDTANNGLEAINLIREADRQSRRSGRKRYDVVLMDLEMPVMDGLQAIKEIRASEAAGTLKRNMVIALTGNARQGQIDQAIAAGMDDVVIKPYVLSNLLKKIKEKSKRLEMDVDAH